MTDQLPFPTPENPNGLPLHRSEETSRTDTVAPENALAPEAQPTLNEVREAIEVASADAAALSQSVAKVDLNFPVIGFIDPIKELENLRQVSASMLESDKKAYPELIRAKLLAHKADETKNPPVTDEELALAIYLRRTTDTPLTEADIEAKTTGKIKKDPNAPKAPRQSKAKKTSDDMLKDLGL